MFKKLLVGSALATALIAGIGTASAAGSYYHCEGRMVHDHIPYGNVMWVVNPYKNFAKTFQQNGKKWHFKGTILNCGNGKWAGYYES
ncbi:hypothetical protein Xmau_00792 [Xenorhabdus mauleonii]|uniref:Antimicrobial protein n=1 Tax=Xenorhabdus mauleonii TaxID=351675 RepID=A0A1I3RWJ0_9GAMM|nr:LCI fold-containing protein [Xenorhabdus mauleonii]PHM46381.1 hypothetical protein Xmau_00792 [Xenorhabdus mauleonii]SFJ50954.1 antimicrobial protein [Xenorhabdus mauleonii]